MARLLEARENFPSPRPDEATGGPIIPGRVGGEGNADSAWAGLSSSELRPPFLSYSETERTMSAGPAPETPHAAEALSPALRIVLLAVLFLALLALFASRFVLVQLLIARLGFPLILACATALASTTAGCLVYRGFARLSGSPAGPGSLSLTACFIVGYPIFGALCFLCALATTSRWAMLAVLLIFIAVAPKVLRLDFSTGSSEGSWNVRSIAAIALLAMALLMGILAAQLPASSLDELAYHLAVPKLWLSHGRAIELPLLSHSYFPLGVESADLPALAVLGDAGGIASHFLHLFAAMATIILVYRSFLNRRVDAAFALICLAGLMTTPALVVTSGLSWNDWPLLGIVVVLFSAIGAWSDRARAAENPVAIVAAAIAAGLLCKYTFIPIAAALLAAGFIASPAMRGDRKVLRPLIMATALGSVFFVRNLVTTGNPVAPFFEQNAPEVEGFRRGTNVLDTFSGYVFDGRFVDESLGVVILFLPLSLIVLAPSLRRERYELFTVTLLVPLLLVLFFVSPSSRILLPYLLISSIVAVAALSRLLSEKPLASTVVSYLLLFTTLMQLYVAGFYTASLEPMSLLNGRFSDEEYLAAHRSSFLRIKAVDRALPPHSRTLVIGVQELFFFDKPVLGGGNFDGPRIDRYLGAESVAALAARMRRDGITHLAMFPDGLRGEGQDNRKIEERVTRLSQPSAALLRELLSSHAIPAADIDGAMLFRLR